MKLFLGWFLFMVFLFLVWIVGENKNDRTVAVSVIVCGTSTFLFWSYRTKAANFFAFHMSPRKKFVLIGGLGAVWAETVFWFFEKVVGASGVAANPNLLLDLLATMPWYLMMLFLLFKVETKYHYSYTEVLLLGGIYELGADGIFGQAMGGVTPLNLVLVFVVIPMFVIVYSVIVLPPTYILRRELEGVRTKEGQHKYWYALLPLLGLLPYFVVVPLLF